MEKDKRPSFITLYFENVDTQGHVHGPGSVILIALSCEVSSNYGIDVLLTSLFRAK